MLSICDSNHFVPGLFSSQSCGFIQCIEKSTGLNISIKNKKNNTGSITFEYQDLDQLNRIIEIIKSNY